MNKDQQCPYLLDCIQDEGKCLRHQWYSKTKLSHAAQEFLLSLDFMYISDEIIDGFVFDSSE